MEKAQPEDPARNHGKWELVPHRQQLTKVSLEMRLYSAHLLTLARALSSATSHRPSLRLSFRDSFALSDADHNTVVQYEGSLNQTIGRLSCAIEEIPRDHSQHLYPSPSSA